MTAVEARDRLALLHAEQALASQTALANDAAYMADLEQELQVTEAVYVGASVTEIATLRAAIWGRQRG